MKHTKNIAKRKNPYSLVAFPVNETDRAQESLTLKLEEGNKTPSFATVNFNFVSSLSLSSLEFYI